MVGNKIVAVAEWLALPLAGRVVRLCVLLGVPALFAQGKVNRPYSRRLW